jgi:uncharacterized protein YciI
MEKKYFLYKLTLTEKYQKADNWDENAEKIISEHFYFLEKLGKEGTLLFAGRTSYEPGDERLFGIAVVKAESLEAAEMLLSKDPAVINGIMTSVMYDYSIAIKHFENAE